jgi:hypothetical protein
MGWARLMLASVAFNAVVASVGLDRLVVQMPAWRQVGVRAWAAYSRHADLGNAWMLYPVAAFSGTALAIAAVLKVRIDRAASRTTRLAVYATASFATLGLLATTQAAPYMLSLQRLADDPAALEHAFIGFDRWGGVRAVAQILALATNLWSLVGVTGTGLERRRVG